jgi:protein-L-isoaspartate(D-aspartate) O-methyltransferase
MANVQLGIERPLQLHHGVWLKLRARDHAFVATHHVLMPEISAQLDQDQHERPSVAIALPRHQAERHVSDFPKLRQDMVNRQIYARGVRDPRVLDAMRSVPREKFVPKALEEFAYNDSPLPIDAAQTISQPYIVAFMIAALNLKGGERVLEIGAGSGYAAAVLSRIAQKVFTVERIAELAEKAAGVLAALHYDNVIVRCGDGTEGWAEFAPFDAIVVAAGGPEVPESLRQQLKVGGRLVIPIGKNQRSQELIRVTRTSADTFISEDIADVRFVPLIGKEGWAANELEFQRGKPKPSAQAKSSNDVAQKIARACTPFASIDSANLEPLMQRIGDAKVVLIGEATHGTSEFYQMRERISRELIESKKFSFVAIEGDWPDAARIDHYVRHLEFPASEWTAFARFPRWMWRNAEVRNFVDWLRARNAAYTLAQRTAFYGLDLYSLYTSITEVLRYLDRVDPEAARLARQRYGCLTPWQNDPAAYGQAALSAGYRTCEKNVIEMLRDIHKKQDLYMISDGEKYNDVINNARLIASAERYYRIMYYGSRASWNLRDGHMFETLKSLLAFHGPDSKAIVWAHNSHIGNAAATEMAARGETNIGELCRNEFGAKLYTIGFGTHSGRVAAASDWGAEMERKVVQASHVDSYERLCHDTQVARFMLPLREADIGSLREDLSRPRLERAIGVIYRPETELASHYFQAILPNQFDEYIWFDETSPVSPIETLEVSGLPDTYPFGL